MMPRIKLSIIHRTERVSTFRIRSRIIHRCSERIISRRPFLRNSNISTTNRIRIPTTPTRPTIPTKRPTTRIRTRTTRRKHQEEVTIRGSEEVTGWEACRAGMWATTMRRVWSAMVVSRRGSRGGTRLLNVRLPFVFCHSFPFSSPLQCIAMV